MRVLMLSWDHSPRATSGTAAHVDGLTRALAAAGHEVALVTTDLPIEVTASARADRPRLAPAIGSVNIARTSVDLPWIPSELPIAQKASGNHALVKRGLQPIPGSDWRPDVVHGHDWKVGWAADTLAAIFDVPLVTTMHGVERLRHSGQLPDGMPTDINAVEWWLALRSDRLIAATRLMVEQLVTGFELDADHAVRIPNGINAAEWAVPGAGPWSPLDERARRRGGPIVAWGNIQYEKGFQVLARAIGVLRSSRPELRCVIAGRGRYLAELQTQLDVEGVSDVIDLPGYVPFESLRALVRRASCVVVPSLYEPFGIVALEALAAGAPVVVAHTGGLAELVYGTGAGLTFEPGSPLALADAIDEILSNPDLASDLSERARELVQRSYTWEAIAGRTVEVYHDAIAERSRLRRPTASENRQ